MVRESNHIIGGQPSSGKSTFLSVFDFINTFGIKNISKIVSDENSLIDYYVKFGSGKKELLDKINDMSADDFAKQFWRMSETSDKESLKFIEKLLNEGFQNPQITNLKKLLKDALMTFKGNEFTDDFLNVYMTNRTTSEPFLKNAVSTEISRNLIDVFKKGSLDEIRKLNEILENKEGKYNNITEEKISKIGSKLEGMVNMDKLSLYLMERKERINKIVQSLSPDDSEFLPTWKLCGQIANMNDKNYRREVSDVISTLAKSDFFHQDIQKISDYLFASRIVLSKKEFDYYSEALARLAVETLPGFMVKYITSKKNLSEGKFYVILPWMGGRKYELSDSLNEVAESDIINVTEALGEHIKLIAPYLKLCKKLMPDVISPEKGVDFVLDIPVSEKVKKEYLRDIYAKKALNLFGEEYVDLKERKATAITPNGFTTPDNRKVWFTEIGGTVREEDFPKIAEEEDEKELADIILDKPIYKKMTQKERKEYSSKLLSKAIGKKLENLNIDWFVDGNSLGMPGVFIKTSYKNKASYNEVCNIDSQIEKILDNLKNSRTNYFIIADEIKKSLDFELSGFMNNAFKNSVGYVYEQMAVLGKDSEDVDIEAIYEVNKGVADTISDEFKKNIKEKLAPKLLEKGMSQEIVKKLIESKEGIADSYLNSRVCIDVLNTFFNRIFEQSDDKTAESGDSFWFLVKEIAKKSKSKDKKKVYDRLEKIVINKKDRIYERFKHLAEDSGNHNIINKYINILKNKMEFMTLGNLGEGNSLKLESIVSPIINYKSESNYFLNSIEEKTEDEETKTLPICENLKDIMDLASKADYGKNGFTYLKTHVAFKSKPNNPFWKSGISTLNSFDEAIKAYSFFKVIYNFAEIGADMRDVIGNKLYRKSSIVAIEKKDENNERLDYTDAVRQIITEMINPDVV
ncbi:MAG: hypothetical protein PHW96_00130 [Candidatus Nanoarchaeia archaeon]|nr:hypothetical protein [Candidatus Nanoarchaeia archaeon]